MTSIDKHYVYFITDQLTDAILIDNTEDIYKIINKLNNEPNTCTNYRIIKILEIKADQQKVRVGLKQTENDPFDWFKNKKINDIITVQVISSDNKGLLVKPEGCELEFVIKKSQIAINSADARPSRFVGSERIDAAIAELDIDKRKASLSIKLLEELKNKEAVSKFSSPLSGKNLPFSSLSDKLEKKEKKKKKE